MKHYFDMNFTKLLFGLLVGLLSFNAADLQAQDGAKQEKMHAMKVGYLTQELNLSPDEAANFWPVYNQYTEELQEVRKGVDQADSDAYIELREKELAIEKKYLTQFKTILPAPKVDRLKTAEKEFKRKLLEIARDRRAGGQ